MQLVNEFDAAYPIPCGKIAVALLVILPAHEVPKEITTIHMAHLVTKEKTQVITKGRLFVLTEIEVVAIILLLLSLPAAMNTWKYCFAVVHVVKVATCHLVFCGPFTVDIAPIADINRP